MARKKLVVLASAYNALPCSLEGFTINGMEADGGDFGSMEDINPDDADDYGCGDMQFIPKMPTDEVIKKYKINLKEYSEICNKLVRVLSVGNCGWCI